MREEGKARYRELLEVTTVTTDQLLSIGYLEGTLAYTTTIADLKSYINLGGYNANFNKLTCDIYTTETLQVTEFFTFDPPGIINGTIFETSAEVLCGSKCKIDALNLPDEWDFGDLISSGDVNLLFGYEGPNINITNLLTVGIDFEADSLTTTSSVFAAEICTASIISSKVDEKHALQILSDGTVVQSNSTYICVQLTDDAIVPFQNTWNYIENFDSVIQDNLNEWVIDQPPNPDYAYFAPKKSGYFMFTFQVLLHEERTHDTRYMLGICRKYETVVAQRSQWVSCGNWVGTYDFDLPGNYAVLSSNFIVECTTAGAFYAPVIHGKDGSETDVKLKKVEAGYFGYPTTRLIIYRLLPRYV